MTRKIARTLGIFVAYIGMNIIVGWSIVIAGWPSLVMSLVVIVTTAWALMTVTKIWKN